MEITLIDAISPSTAVSFFGAFLVSFVVYGFIYAYTMSAEKKTDKNGEKIYKHGKYVSNKLAFITYISMVFATSSCFALSDIQENIDSIQENHPKTIFQNEFSKISSGIDDRRTVNVNQVIGHDDILDVTVMDKEKNEMYQFRVYNDGGEIKEIK